MCLSRVLVILRSAALLAERRHCRTPGGRSYPPALVVLHQLEIEALAVHPSGHASNACPGIEPRAERPESPVIRGARKPGETEGCDEESAALVEHELLDDLVGL